MFGDKVSPRGIWRSCQRNARIAQLRRRGDQSEPRHEALGFLFRHQRIDLRAVANDLFVVADLLAQGHTIVVPADGIGTGFPELPTARRAYTRLSKRFGARESVKYPDKEITMSNGRATDNIGPHYDHGLEFPHDGKATRR